METFAILIIKFQHKGAPNIKNSKGSAQSIFNIFSAQKNVIWIMNYILCIASRQVAVTIHSYQWPLTVEAQFFSHTYVEFVVDKIALQ